MPYYGKHRTDDGYLKELPADAQPAFNPAKSFESNCMADNGRRFIYRGSTIPFAISKQEFGEPQVPVKHVVLPKNEPYKELVPFATVCAPTMKIMPVCGRVSQLSGSSLALCSSLLALIHVIRSSTRLWSSISSALRRLSSPPTSTPAASPKTPAASSHPSKAELVISYLSSSEVRSCTYHNAENMS